MLDLLEQAVIEVGLDGVIQVASFHPAYRFDDAPMDDPANFTNRSPFPMFHLIREEGLAAALESHPSPESIPQRNVARLRELGIADGDEGAALKNAGSFARSKVRDSWRVADDDLRVHVQFAVGLQHRITLPVRAGHDRDRRLESGWRTNASVSRNFHLAQRNGLVACGTAIQIGRDRGLVASTFVGVCYVGTRCHFLFSLQTALSLRC